MKSLKEVTPFNCIAVGNTVKTTGYVHSGVLNLPALKFKKFDPASTSLKSQFKPGDALENDIPVLVNVQ